MTGAPTPPENDPADSASSDGEPSLTPPPASETFGRALGQAAKRAGLDPTVDASTGQVVWSAIGGVRGIFEAVLPGLAFLILFTTTNNLPLALIVSVALAAVFTVLRLVQRSSPGGALGGFVATAIAATIASITGRAEDTFVWGFVTNAVWAGAFIVSALIGWSIIGLAAGFLTDQGTAWREDPRQRRAYFWLALGWAGLFVLRLAAQLPFYFAGNVAALGTIKLVLGVPPFAVLIAVTWFVVRRVMPNLGAVDRSRR